MLSFRGQVALIRRSPTFTKLLRGDSSYNKDEITLNARQRPEACNFYQRRSSSIIIRFLSRALLFLQARGLQFLSVSFFLRYSLLSQSGIVILASHRNGGDGSCCSMRNNYVICNGYNSEILNFIVCSVVL